MIRMEKGFIQVYTRNGKGKTTAAIGQVIRAAGHGFITCFIVALQKILAAGQSQ